MKAVFKGWNPFELVWLFLFTSVAIVLSILWQSSIFSFFVFLSGILCVVLVAKGNIWNYAFGLFNSVGYAWTSWQNGLYGEVMLNLLFFVPTGIIGWILWSKKTNHAIVQMRRMKGPFFSLVCAGCLAAPAAVGFWLAPLKGQNPPYMDAFNVSASIAATILMMARYREQWALYIAINIAETAMWAIRWASGSTDAPAMAVMWFAYLVNSLYGLYTWNKGSRPSTRLEGRHEKNRFYIGKIRPAA